MLHGIVNRVVRGALIACLAVSGGGFLQKADGTEEEVPETSRGVFRTIGDDYKSFYSLDRLLGMGIGFGAGAILANTDGDQEVQNWYQDDVQSSTSDDIAKVAKLFGEGKIIIPLAFLSAGVNYIDEDTVIGDWGAHTSRALLVGAPAMLFMQAATGGSRPDETGHNDSNWDPFEDVNGVSGHSFMGAVPFIVVARMNDDNLWLKSLAYAGSTVAAWSRLNDDDHYLSQIALGWYMAWEAVDATYDADEELKKVAIQPFFTGNGYGLALNVKW